MAFSITSEEVDLAIASVTDNWDEPLDEVHDIPPIRNAILALLSTKFEMTGFTSTGGGGSGGGA